MKKELYCVIISNVGYVCVEADCAEEAEAIASNTPTNEINWCDDWNVTDSYLVEE